MRSFPAFCFIPAVVAMIATMSCGARTEIERLAPLAVSNTPPKACVAGVVTSTLTNPASLALDGSNIYWIDQGRRSMAADTRIGRCPKSGCPAIPEVLYGPVASVGALALDETAIYWTEFSHTVRSCAKADCAPRSLFTDPTDPPITLLPDGDALHILSFHAVETCPKAGCTTPTKLTTLATGALVIAADGTSIYYTVPSPPGTPVELGRGAVFACDKPACAGGPRSIASSLPATPWGLALDDSTVYIAFGGAAADPDGAGEIWACPKSGCGTSPTVLAKGRTQPTNLTVDTDTLYWAEQGGADGLTEGKVVSCAKSGCAGKPTVIANRQYLPNSVVIDEACIYWATFAHATTSGSIQRAPKHIF